MKRILASSTPENTLKLFTAEGYKCIGFIMVKLDNALVVWDPTFPQKSRRQIIEAEFTGDFTEGLPAGDKP